MTINDYLKGVAFKAPHSDILLKRVKLTITDDHIIDRVDGEYMVPVCESQIVNTGVHVTVWAGGLIFDKFIRFDSLTVC
jgi:hypothetical protein